MFTRRTIKRGFTLIELLVVMALSSLVLGVLGTLYVYVTSQTGDSLAELLSTDQANGAMSDMAFSARNAISCDTPTLNSVTALRCTLPANGVDLNGDGSPESYRPTSLDKFGREKFTSGARVWYYLSDSTGVFGANGKQLWRATRHDDFYPVSGDRDLTWSLQYGQAGKPRFSLVDALTVSVDPTSGLVSIDLRAESVDSNTRQPSASDSGARQRTVRLQRQVFCENWRT